MQRGSENEKKINKKKKHKQISLSFDLCFVIYLRLE